MDYWLYFSILTTIMTGVATGTVHLTDMIPEPWQKRVVAWAGFFAFANQTVLTAVHVVPLIK